MTTPAQLTQSLMPLDPDDFVHCDSRLSDAIARIKNGGANPLFVVDGDELVGTLSAFDIVVNAVAEDRNITETTVLDVMSKEIPFCRVTWPTREVARAMAALGVHTLAVLDADDELLGTAHARDLIGTDDSEIIANVLDGLGQEEEGGGDTAHRRSDPTGGRSRGTKAGGAGVYALQPRLRKVRG
jgi:CBS domain-containing protein